MKLDIIIQNNEINMKKCIEYEMKEKVKKLYIFAGTIKESGFDIIEENIIDTKVKLYVYMGIDKKNTTKNLLDNILKYSNEIYTYNNNDLKEFEGTTMIFESEKKAVLYSFSSKISENSLTEDIIMISKITYDFENDEDKKEYKLKLKDYVAIKNIGFEEFSESKIQELIDSKTIFSNKQYEHNVKSIAELLGKKDAPKKEEKVKSDEDINASEFKIPVVELKDDFLDMDIDISGVGETVQKVEPIFEKEDKKVEKKVKAEEINENLYEEENFEPEDDDIEEISDEIIDLDNILLTRASIKLKEKKEPKVKKEKEEQKEDEVIKVKKLDLNNVTNFIMELPAKQQNKKDLDLIKVPNYIRDLIPAFFEFPENSVTVDEDGITTKMRKIQIEIVDCKNQKKYLEKDAKIFQRKSQTFISVLCPSLEKIEYDEKDIVRIIKLSSDVYHIEVVTKDMQEYKIWSKIMNKNLRASDRKYGIM